MAADPHKYPYIFGWAFKEVRGNWIHILRQRICETRDASDTELRDMALAMFMPPQLQDYNQDCTQSGVRAGGEAAVSSLNYNVYSQAGAGGAVAIPTGAATACLPIAIGITQNTDFAEVTDSCANIFGTLFRSRQASAASVNASINQGATWATTGAIMPLTRIWSAFVMAGNRGISVASGSTSSAYTYDGNHWFSGGALPGSNYWGALCYYDGVIVALSGNSFSGTDQATAYSVDGGATWTAGGTLPVSATWINALHIGTVFIAGGRSAQKYCTISSNNGATWTTTNFPTTYAALWVGPFAFGGYAAWVSGSTETDKVLLSDNGSTFSYATMPAAAYWTVFYSNGYYYAADYFAKLLYRSTDLVNWSLHTTYLSTYTPAYTAAFDFPDNRSALIAVGSYENGVIYAPGIQSASLSAAGGAVAGGGAPLAISVLSTGGAVAGATIVCTAVCSPVAVGKAVALPYGAPVAICAMSVSGGAVARPYAPLALSGTVSGGAVAGASVPEGFYQITFGGAIGGGAALEGLTQIVAGGAVAGGVADASIQTSSQIYSQDGIGLAVASATSSLHITVVPVASGGAVAAVTSTPLVLAVKTGLITTVAGGAAIELTGQVASGGAVVGGAATVSANTLANQYSYTAAGGSVAGGIADNIQYAYPITIAGVVASGGYAAQATTVIPVAGGAVAGGNAVLLQSATRSVTGGAVALPAGSTSIGWTGDKTGLSVAGGSAQIIASIALYGSVTAVASGGVTVRATAYADSYGGAVGGGNAPFLGYGVLSLVVTAAAVAGGAGRVSSMIFSPSIDITWTIEDHQPRFTGASADNRFTGIDTQIRFTGG